jgi:hypothetical protein
MLKSYRAAEKGMLAAIMSIPTSLSLPLQCNLLVWEAM